MNEWGQQAWSQHRVSVWRASDDGGDSQTLTVQKTQLAEPWNVIVHNDPVNLMPYVTMTLQRVLGIPKAKAESLMREVHERGKAVVWTGEKEHAELYVQQLHAHQLSASMESTKG